MDDEFCRERARTILELAAKADPFIKRRLLELALNYEKRFLFVLERRAPSRKWSLTKATSNCAY